jgi:magnesium chelatase subunit D
MTMTAFPFDAVVGQDEAKLALRLAATEPRIGGVLLRGEKGSAKTTLARGLAALLGDAPLVELPLGATEDRLVGSLDTRAALLGDGIRFQPGLLAAADGGVLYVDEINLLADHLVDVLLDVAASGENVVERDGVSHRHRARFVLVGSMNPEEGELRPQLLDRFGLCVEVRAPRDVADRVESVRRRLAFDAGEALLTRPVTGHGPPPSGHGPPAGLPEPVMEAASRLALEVGAEGLRADLTLCRAAAALAGLEGRDKAGVDDLRRVAPLVLAHRSRRGPFDPPVVPPDDLAQAVANALDPPDIGLCAPPGDDTTPRSDTPRPGGTPPTDGTPRPGDTPGPDGSAGGTGRAANERPLVLGAVRRPPIPPSRSGPSARGRAVGDRPAGPTDGIALVPTVRALASSSPRSAGLEPGDLRAAVRVAPRPRTIVLCVDLSGSMGGPERAAAASGTVLGLLDGAYQQRDRVALVTFRGQEASVVLSPTSSVEVARNRLDDLTTGGETPLAAGVLAGLDVARRSSRTGSDALLVVLTDGRATGPAGDLDQALEAAAEVKRLGTAALVLDCETGVPRLGLAASLAEAMGARHVPVTELDPHHLARTIRSAP